MIEITGNRLLPVSEYLTFTKLDDSSQYRGLTLPEIKARFEKHPYIKKADVVDLGNNIIKAYLTEKNIEAVLLSAGEPHFISDEFQILPILPNTKFTDFTIISNSKNALELKPLSYLKSDDIIEAFKIIEASKLSNEDMAKKLSEINLRDGGDIILTFSEIKPPVLFGKGDAAKKMEYLNIMLKSPEGSSMIDTSAYIDLRFADEIFVGASNKAGTAE